MLPARLALRDLPSLLRLSVGHATTGAQTPHTIPSIATEQQLQLLGVQGEKPPGLGGCRLLTEHPWGRSTAGQVRPENQVSAQPGAANRGAGWFLAGAAAAL